MILITADLHLNDLPRDAYRHDWMRTILPSLLRKHKAELLLILGDLTDDKDSHSAWLTNSIVDHLNNLTEICPIIVLQGNHDYVVAENPFFEFLGQIEGITWIGSICDPYQISGPLGHALFLPHTANYKRDWAEFNFQKQDLIFAHQTFQGASIGPRKLDGIPTDIFPAHSLVISGDIHVPQTFAQITYVGAPYLCDFGDDYKPRVLLLDQNTLKLQSIPSPGPQKRLIEIGSIADLNRQRMLNKGDILKVRVALAAKDHARWPAIQDEVKAWGADNGYVIYLVQPQVVNTAGGKAKARKVDTRSDEQLLELYAQSRAVNETTLKTGKTLMGKI